MCCCVTATASIECAGWRRTQATGLLKVNLRVLGVNAHGDMALHVDTLDLNAARQRVAFSKQAAEELHVKEEIIRHDLGQVWMKLEHAARRADRAGPCAARSRWTR